MADMISGQPRRIEACQDRPIIVIIETDDDGKTYNHGVMVGPAGMSDSAAIACLDAAFLRAAPVGGKEWNYGEVLAAMVAAGFESV